MGTISAPPKFRCLVYSCRKFRQTQILGNSACQTSSHERKGQDLRSVLHIEGGTNSKKGCDEGPVSSGPHSSPYGELCPNVLITQVRRRSRGLMLPTPPKYSEGDTHHPKAICMISSRQAQTAWLPPLFPAETRCAKLLPRMNPVFVAFAFAFAFGGKRIQTATENNNILCGFADRCQKLIHGPVIQQHTVHTP